MRDLSVLIPARNEVWLNRTLEDVLSHKECNTEVLVALDGGWPQEGIPDHPDLTLVMMPEAIGQRACTNLLARLSDARYVMKLDAHCAIAPGFDRVLIEAGEKLGKDVTQIPRMYNLHVFDWLCDHCGHRHYQGPTVPCPDCGNVLRKDVVWKPRWNRQTDFARFNRDLIFQYWGSYGLRPEVKAEGEIADMMSSVGACFFMRRDRFFELGGLDERHGGWGQFGTEIACKSWLSGGRHVVNKGTWFAHLFRTQGGDFSFPYPLKQSQVEVARAHSRWLWQLGNWEGAIRTLGAYVRKFAPLPDWTLPTKGIVYYSDGRLPADIRNAVLARLKATGLPIAAHTLGINFEGERSPLTMFRQILAGLEALETDVAFLCEHDVLYHPSHFEFDPPQADRYYYNQHVWKVRTSDGHAVHYRCSQTSGLAANRALLVDHYRKRVAEVEAHGFSRRNGFEPGTRQCRHGGFDDVPAEIWMSPFPNIDIRHGKNLTASRWNREEFRNQKYCQGWQEAEEIPGWGRTKDRFPEFLQLATNVT